MMEETTTTPTLAQCPVCGKRDQVEMNNWSFYHPHQPRCTNCGLMFFAFGQFGGSPQTAAAAWNSLAAAVARGEVAVNLAEALESLLSILKSDGVKVEANSPLAAMCLTVANADAHASIRAYDALTTEATK